MLNFLQIIVLHAFRIFFYSGNPPFFKAFLQHSFRDSFRDSIYNASKDSSCFGILSGLPPRFFFEKFSLNFCSKISPRSLSEIPPAFLSRFHFSFMRFLQDSYRDFFWDSPRDCFWDSFKDFSCISWGFLWESSKIPPEVPFNILWGVPPGFFRDSPRDSIWNSFRDS